MDVGDALRERRTVRAFLPRPAPRETLEAILADALRTPSWANTQPWEIFVAGGETFERIRRIWEERTLAKIPSNPDLPFPGAWTPECRDRTKELTAMRADVRGHRDRAQVDRAAGADLSRPLLRIRGVAGEERRVGRDRRGDAR